MTVPGTRNEQVWGSIPHAGFPARGQKVLVQKPEGTFSSIPYRTFPPVTHQASYAGLRQL